MTEELEVTAEQKPKKKIAVLSIVSILLAALGLVIAIFTFLCTQLQSISDIVSFINVNYLIFRYDTVMISTISALCGIVNLIRDIVLIVLGVVGLLISSASLILNIKNKSYIAAIIGTIALTLSIINIVISIAVAINPVVSMIVNSIVLRYIL